MAEHHTIMKACRSLRQTDWDGVLLRHYPLLTRGWTFQERILARRCVHFTVKELVWECKCEYPFSPLSPSFPSPSSPLDPSTPPTHPHIKPPASNHT